MPFTVVVAIVPATRAPTAIASTNLEAQGVIPGADGVTVGLGTIW